MDGSFIYYYAAFSTSAFAMTFLALIVMLYRSNEASSSVSCMNDNNGNVNITSPEQ